MNHVRQEMVAERIALSLWQRVEGVRFDLRLPQPLVRSSSPLLDVLALLREDTAAGAAIHGVPCIGYCPDYCHVWLGADPQTGTRLGLLFSATEEHFDALAQIPAVDLYPCGDILEMTEPDEYLKRTSAWTRAFELAGEELSIVPIDWDYTPFLDALPNSPQLIDEVIAAMPSETDRARLLLSGGVFDLLPQMQLEQSPDDEWEQARMVSESVEGYAPLLVPHLRPVTREIVTGTVPISPSEVVESRDVLRSILEPLLPTLIGTGGQRPGGGA